MSTLAAGGAFAVGSPTWWAKRFSAAAATAQKPKSRPAVQLAPPPVIRLSLVVQVPHTRNKRCMTLCSCPIDSFALSFKGSKYVVCMVFGHIVFYVASFGPAFGPGFNIDIRHTVLLRFVGQMAMHGHLSCQVGPHVNFIFQEGPKLLH